MAGDVTCKCPDCGRKTNGIIIRKDSFGRRAAKKGTNYAAGAGIGFLLGGPLGAGIGTLAAKALSCTDAYNEATESLVDPMFKKDTCYKYSCSCGNTWTYTVDEAEVMHQEMIESEAKTTAWKWCIGVVFVLFVLQLMIADEWTADLSVGGMFGLLIFYLFVGFVVWKIANISVKAKYDLW